MSVCAATSSLMSSGTPTCASSSCSLTLFQERAVKYVHVAGHLRHLMFRNSLKDTMPNLTTTYIDRSMNHVLMVMLETCASRATAKVCRGHMRRGRCARMRKCTKNSSFTATYCCHAAWPQLADTTRCWTFKRLLVPGPSSSTMPNPSLPVQ